MERNGQQQGLSTLIYVRVSRDTSGVGRSVAEQEQECRAEAERRGWRVVEVLEDNDRSASRYAKKTRPAYRKALDLLPKVDVLLTWEASRAQRDFAAYVQLADLCRENDVLWCYSGRVHDLDDPDDEFTTGLDALLAGRESGWTRKRVLRSMRGQREKGRPPGRVKWGYQRLYDPETGALDKQVEDPDTAPLVRELARRVLNGESLYSISGDFNRRGIGTPGGAANWNATIIRTALRSPTYIGKREHRGEIVGDGNWPAILNEEDFFQLRARFAPARETVPRDSRAAALLSGIARCGVCGETMKRRRPAKKATFSYVCRNRGCVGRQMAWLDAYVTEAALRRLENLGVRVEAADHAPGLAEERDALKLRLDGFYTEAADGRLSPAGLTAVEQKLTPQIDELDRRIRESTMPPEVAHLAGSGVRDRWPSLPLENKRAALRALVDVRVLRSPGKRDTDAVDLEFRV